jgi:serine/threonine protein phosphatase PrpC
MADFIRRLFGGASAPTGSRATTAPVSDGEIRSGALDLDVPYDVQQLIAATGQSAGRQREHNEDSLLAITTTLAGRAANVPFGLYVVADGMGGHQFGEVASNAAIRTIAGQITDAFRSYLFSITTEQPKAPMEEIMASAIKEAHRTVQKQAPGGGTTLTAALVLGQQLTIGHVGDSRAYAIEATGRVEQLTHDHSLVQRLEELGHLNKAEAATFPHRNVLIRALGQGDSLDVDIFTIPFPHRGTLMLCTDGLWGVLQEKDIIQGVVQAPSLQRACQNLVTAANTAGGPDNISVVMVQMVE